MDPTNRRGTNDGRKGMVTGKVWGRTQPLHKCAAVEVHRVSIAPNSHCSLHMHRWRRNDFFVLSGRLTIEVQKVDYPLTDKTELGPGDYTSVAPGEYHRFVSGDEPVEALEIYYPEPLNAEDITRADHGGRILGA
jgi:mannose-6-phosphate isomerase-like protein (cupin superfamily)